MTWRSSNRSGRPDTVRIALNGRRPVTLRASTRLRTDRFEVPAAPEDCLILRFHPSVEDEIEVRTISVDPLASRTQPPLGWIFSILAVPIALSFIPIRHGTVLALIVALASTIVGFVVWRPFAYLYALLHHPLAVMTVQFACLAVVFFLSRAWLEARGTRRWLGATIVLGASVLLTYAHTLAFGFVWDDFAFIRPPSWDLMGSSFTGSWMTTRFMPHYYRPLVVALYSLDYLLYGTWAIGYHLTNLLCLILGSLLALISVSARLSFSRCIHSTTSPQAGSARGPTF
jgi:hypothetical protein